ncbi:hypothetical protein DIURU_000035 [Diutina rugosa]|uniref:glucan endo-1,3-beta-D-glucosidase n=1 Tax=Diutina rugosa TaxID=5481 RepID=A0A642V009_DIURU|nr:uncharacterized protein DIURU_000035 [Diutina rugosa]KAA8908722.1 hypothetical protein DIURU_000035 [Diutina rugosa]
MGLIRHAIKKFERLNVNHDNDKQQPLAPQQQQQQQQQQQAPQQHQPESPQQPYSRPPAPLPPQSSSKPQSKSASAPAFKPPASSGGDAGIFGAPIATGEPPKIYTKINHAVLPRGCSHGPNDAPLQTNNFASNLALDDQTFPVWPLPYSLWVTRDPEQIPGMAFNHTEAKQRVFGPDPQQNPAQYFFNPPKIKSWVFSAEGLATNATLSIANISKFSANTRFEVNGGTVEFPIVQGMGFVTAIYKGATPVINSQVGVHHWDEVGQVGNMIKYKAVLFNEVVWSVYVSGGRLNLENPNVIKGGFNQGFIQIARGESRAYDDTAGCWPVDVQLGGDDSTYTLSYQLSGQSSSGKTLLWTLPHQYETLAANNDMVDAQMQLDSPVKGVMKAFVANQIKVTEQDLPRGISFDPWSERVSQPQYSQQALDLIRAAASSEVQEDVVGMANIDSMYTSGKILDKYAHIAWVTKFVLKDDQLTATVLDKLKKAIDIFAQNKQKFPLRYDTMWKGIVSSAEPAADFGNANYNDHHFHYGYHIHAIALVAKVDPNYLNEYPHVREYATTLLRDVASPQADAFFPQFRSFDWYHGHSWAHGLFPSGDGKNEESSSEDYHCYFGMKLWAQVIGDQAMEARANLILAIMRRSINKYMLYSLDNKVEPQQFIGNMVSGIHFENKIDYSTFFGRGSVGDEWIHGIHMLPTTPISNYMRGSKYIKEEWDRWLAPVIDRVDDGWKGICLLNYGGYDARAAYSFFAGDNFKPHLIDNGMSRTWSLAYLAGIGGDR